MQPTTSKSFWERPEGKFGMGLLAVIIGLGGFLLFKVLPFVLIILTNALHALFLGIALLVLLVIVTDKRMQLNAKALFQMVARSITGAIIPIDPIGILEDHLKTLRKALEKGGVQLNLLAGQEKKLITKIQSNEKLMEGYKQTAVFASKKLTTMDQNHPQYLDTQNAAGLNANKAGRLGDSNAKYAEVLNKITSLRKVLEKVNKNAEFILEDMTDDVANRKSEYEAINAGYSAFTKAKSVLQGDSDSTSMYNETLEHLADNMANKVGEIERFMTNSSGMLTTMDLNNEASLNRGIAMITEWEQDKSLTSTYRKGQLAAPVVEAVRSTVSVSNNNSTTKNKYL